MNLTLGTAHTGVVVVSIQSIVDMELEGDPGDAAAHGQITADDCVGIDLVEGIVGHCRAAAGPAIADIAEIAGKIETGTQIDEATNIDPLAGDVADAPTNGTTAFIEQDVPRRVLDPTFCGSVYE